MTAIQQNRITLKALKVADFASHETLCFVATVLLDGKPIAAARNDGHGGCTCLDALEGAEATFAEAEAFAKSLPSVIVDDPDDSSQTFTIDVTLDYLVDELAEALHTEKKIRAAFNRDFTDKVLFLKDNELRFLQGIKLRTVSDKVRLFAHLRARHGPKVIILSELPREQAFELWKKHAVEEDAP